MHKINHNKAQMLTEFKALRLDGEMPSVVSADGGLAVALLLLRVLLSLGWLPAKQM